MLKMFHVILVVTRFRILGEKSSIASQFHFISFQDKWSYFTPINRVQKFQANPFMFRPFIGAVSCHGSVSSIHGTCEATGFQAQRSGNTVSSRSNLAQLPPCFWRGADSGWKFPPFVGCVSLLENGGIFQPAMLVYSRVMGCMKNDLFHHIWEIYVSMFFEHFPPKYHE